jgi:GNAT superfamily N-acetyltransferase
VTPSSNFFELDKAIHDRESFDCGTDELNHFLQQFAARHRAAGVSMTMVLPTNNNGVDICAYYTLSHTEIARKTLPQAVAKKLPHYPIPVILIAQLAVHKRAHGKGVGKITLIRALQHAHEINGHLPSYAVVVDALDDQVQGFYEQYGFEILNTDNHRRRLFISMQTIGQLFAE